MGQIRRLNLETYILLCLFLPAMNDSFCRLEGVNCAQEQSLGETGMMARPFDFQQGLFMDLFIGVVLAFLFTDLLRRLRGDGVKRISSPRTASTWVVKRWARPGAVLLNLGR